MSSQRYERVSLLPCQPLHVPTAHRRQLMPLSQVAAHDEDDSPISPQLPQRQDSIPSSPPPSFRSRASSRRSSLQRDQPQSAIERSLTDAFAGSPDDDSDDEHDDRRRLVQDHERTVNDEAEAADSPPRPGNIQRRVTQLPVFTPTPSTSGRVYGGGSNTRDGVFANISAKPTRGEELEEKPPVSFYLILSSYLPFQTASFPVFLLSRR